MHGIFVGNWLSNDDKSYPLRSVFTDTFAPPWRGIIGFRYTLLYICATFSSIWDTENPSTCLHPFATRH